MENEVGSDVSIQQKSAQEAPLSATTHSINSLRDVERPDDGVFDSNSSKYISQNYRRAAGATYVLSMGVCGIVLVALASSLKGFAIEVDKTSIQASSKPEYDVIRNVRWFLFLSACSLHCLVSIVLCSVPTLNRTLRQQFVPCRLSECLHSWYTSTINAFVQLASLESSNFEQQSMVHKRYS